MKETIATRIMVCNYAKGGMRSVVEAYQRDGFLDQQHIEIVTAYADGGFIKKQCILAAGLSRYFRLLFTRRVSLVHIHMAMRGSFWRKSLFASFAYRLGIPTVLHLHGSEMASFYKSLPSFAKGLVRKRLESSSCVIVLSKSWADFVMSIAPAAIVRIVPNYVSIPAEVDPELRQHTDVLFLGLLGKRKGVYDLLPAFQQTLEHVPTARLVLAGNGEVDHTRQLVASLALDEAVSLPGWIDGADRLQLLERSGIYVLPSYNEGLPMSVLEAMAAGLPVITTTVGGIPELIADGIDGFLIQPGDVDALSKKIRLLLQDRLLAHRIGYAARAKIISTYSPEAVLPLLRQAYYEAEKMDKRRVASQAK